MIHLYCITTSIFIFQGKMITRQQQILKGMVAVFVFCQCFTIVADVYELICTLGAEQCDYNVHIENLINVAHLMLALNASVNFIFYMMNIDNFKESFIQVKIQKPCNELLSFIVSITYIVDDPYLFCNALFHFHVSDIFPVFKVS